MKLASETSYKRYELPKKESIAKALSGILLLGEEEIMRGFRAVHKSLALRMDKTIDKLNIGKDGFILIYPKLKGGYIHTQRKSKYSIQYIA